MNYYLLFLSVYSLCILPLTLQVELRLGKRFAYRLRVRVTGMGVYSRRRKQAKKSGSDEMPAIRAKEHDVTETLFQLNATLLRCLLSREFWRSALRFIECPGVWIRIRVAFSDAAATALTYGVIATVIDTLKRMEFPLSRLHVEAKASFSGEGGETVVGGILLVRLGSLALVASRFLVQYQKARGENSGGEQTVLEEKEHATAASDR